MGTRLTDTQMEVRRTILYWLPMPFLGVINGTFRQFVLLDHVDDLAAHQLSAFTLILLLAVYIRIIIRRSGIRTTKGAWVTGAVWLGLTVLFEFGLGYFVSHLTLEQMLADYNVLEGRLWPLVLLSVLTLPVILFRAGSSGN